MRIHKKLNYEHQIYSIGKEYEKEKLLHNDLSSITIFEKLGKKYHKSGSSIQKYAEFARAVDRIEEKVQGKKELLLSGNFKVIRESIVRISHSTPQKIERFFEEIELCGEIQAIENFKNQQNIQCVPEVKKTPEYNPNSSVTSLYFTIPSWCKMIDDLSKNADLSNISIETNKKLIDVLNDLDDSIIKLLMKLEGKNKNE